MIKDHSAVDRTGCLFPTSNFSSDTRTGENSKDSGLSAIHNFVFFIAEGCMSKEAAILYA